jgi:hypothetical protein
MQRRGRALPGQRGPGTGVPVALALAVCLGAAAQAAPPPSPFEPALPPAPSLPPFRPVERSETLAPESDFACDPSDPGTTVHSCEVILEFYCGDFARDHPSLLGQFLAGRIGLGTILANMDYFDQHSICEKFFESAAQVVSRKPAP